MSGFDRGAEGARQGGDDVQKNHQGSPLADAPLSDHFTQPHHHHRAGDQGQCRLHHKGHFAEAFHGVLAQDHREDDALDETPTERHITGDLGDLASAGLAFILLEVFQLRQRCGQQLEDDRGVDEGQDPQGKDAQGGDPAAGEDVEKTDQLSALIDELLERFPIDSGHRDVDPKAHQQQQAECGEHTTAEPRVGDQLADHFGGVGVATPTDEHVRKKVKLGEKPRSRPWIEIQRTAQTLGLTWGRALD